MVGVVFPVHIAGSEPQHWHVDCYWPVLDEPLGSKLGCHSHLGTPATSESSLPMNVHVLWPVAEVFLFGRRRPATGVGHDDFWPVFYVVVTPGYVQLG